MKNWILLISMCMIMRGYGQSIPSRQTLASSPTALQCDSLGTMSLQSHFWRNMMPMADNNVLHWSCYISSGNDPFENRSCCGLVTQRIFFLYPQEVITFHVNSTCKYGEREVYATPDMIVIEYIDSMTGDIGYIKTSGPFYISAVD